jgi:hypothetical protein
VARPQRQLHLGYGRDDRFADAHRLLATQLPAAQVFDTPGGHDWPVWRAAVAAVAGARAAGTCGGGTGVNTAAADRTGGGAGAHRHLRPWHGSTRSPSAWPPTAARCARTTCPACRCPAPSAALRRWKTCPGRAEWAAWDSRATRLAWLGLQADGFIDAVARGAPAPWRGARGAGAGHLGVDHRGVGSGLPAARRRGAISTGLRHATLNTPHAVTAFVQQALALEGPALTVSTACSSSAKALAVAERWLRLGLVDAVVCRRRRRAGRQPAVRLPRAGPAGQPNPAAPSTPGARASASARPRPMPCWNAGRVRCAWPATAKATMRFTCPARTRRGWAPSGRWPTRWRAPGWPPGRRLRQPARHGQHRQRRGRGRAGGTPLPPRRARLRHQGPDRPRDGRGRPAGSRDLPAGAAARAAGRQRTHAAGRPRPGPGFRPPLAGPARAAAGAARGQPFVRLRRQQLRAGVRAC